MDQRLLTGIEKSPRIQKLIDHLYEKMPQIEADRAELMTESFIKTEAEPTIIRKAKAFSNILKNIPITIRPLELIVGSATQAPRSCQTFPEFSFDWLESEFDTLETRSADPFYISDQTKARLKKANAYWLGKTTSELATEYMAPEARLAIEHNFFTPGNYFYNGVGHVTVDYGKVLNKGLAGIRLEAENELKSCKVTDDNFAKKSRFLEAVIISLDAVIEYALRYSVLANDLANKESDPTRKAELLQIAQNCKNVPLNPATSFYEACQSFWFIQLLIQMESSGHSISPGRFDQYMYPFYKKDIESGKITLEQAQELVDCVWVKLNDLSKVRDLASAEGFAGYSMFQNLICGGQNSDGVDVTNDVSYMCLEASMHVLLPAPSLSVRIWNLTPHEFMIKAAEVTRTGIGLPAYYNDEVIIPSLVSRGLTIEDARDYNIIGCVEPQKSGKTDGWHDAAFFNMLRPLEMVFSQGVDKGVQVGPKTQDVSSMTTFDELFDAYKKQSDYMVSLMVNADNAIDFAHMERAPLPFLSSMIDDCIKRGKSVQEGGAVYNFTGPQGFGVANMADGLWAIKKLVFEQKKYTLNDFKEAVENNFGEDMDSAMAQKLTAKVVLELHKNGVNTDKENILNIYNKVSSNPCSAQKKAFYKQMLDDIIAQDKFGNDLHDIDAFAREVAYVYTRELEKFNNPRGGKFHAGLYPVSANVPLGAQTGATPDGRLAYTPIADGVSPAAGRDVSGPTAAANSVSRLDHFIASNGTLYNMKFHPTALKGRSGLESFVSLVRGYFDQKGSHMQFNVVSRETLIDAQKHPENYKSLVVRVAGYSALFTTLSRSLQNDIINRTEQGGF
ncbi:MAG: glycyl radical protein [Clostridiales bacterium]|nr:glycyl radical protein [Clostridiales bacterium]